MRLPLASFPSHLATRAACCVLAQLFASSTHAQATDASADEAESRARAELVAAPPSASASEARRTERRASSDVRFGPPMPVPAGVPFLLGGTFASVYAYARTRFGRTCDGCSAAEQKAKELSAPSDGAGSTWSYVAGGIHVAALLGGFVLVAAMETAPSPAGVGTSRMDGLRLVVGPTDGGAAVSLSGRF